MFCRRCRYDLHECASSTCPECGREFDARDSRTFDATPSSTAFGVVVLSFFLGTIAVVQISRIALNEPRATLSTADAAVAALALCGPMLAGWRARLGIAHLLYGAGAGIALLPTVFSAATPSGNPADVADLAVVLIVAGTVVLSMFVGRLAGGLSWRWNNARRARWHRLAHDPVVERRLRRRRRALVTVLAAVAVGIVAWFMTAVLGVMYGTPVVSVNYYERLNANRIRIFDIEDLDASEAAWTALEELLAVVDTTLAEIAARDLPDDFVPRSPNDKGELDFMFVRFGHVVPAAADRERAALAALDQAGVPAGLRALAEGPLPLQPYPIAQNPPLMTLTLPALASLRAMAHIEVARMRIAADEGSTAEVAAIAENVLAFARATSAQGTLIHALVGMAIRALLFDELLIELDEHAFDDQACRALLDALRRHPPVPLDVGLQWQRAMFHDFAQRTCTDDGHGDGYIIPRNFSGIWGPAPMSTPGQALFAVRSRFHLAGRREQLEATDAIFDAALAMAGAEVEERTRARDRLTQIQDDLPERFVLVYHVLPAMTRWIENVQVHASTKTGFELRLAIELFEALHGRAPSGLDELVPALLDVVPLDPMTGTPFGYHVDAGGGAVLYSFGRDGVDDGGHHPDGGETVGWSATDGAGYDVPFTRRRFEPE